MQNFRILNLIDDPLKDKASLITKYKSESVFYQMESPSILKDEIIDLFKTANIDIDSVVVFKTYASNLGGDGNRIIHSDIKWNELTDSWESITCGINWELTDVRGQFKWWNMDALIAVYPESGKYLTDQYAQLNGIHYENRRRVGVPKKAILIEETDTSRPLLVRTDIPHSVTYPGAGRMSISVRFSNNLLKWEDAIARLSSFIV
jgi:hypothetical protein